MNEIFDKKKKEKYQRNILLLLIFFYSPIILLIQFHFQQHFVTARNAVDRVSVCLFRKSFFKSFNG